MNKNNEVKKLNFLKRKSSNVNSTSLYWPVARVDVVPMKRTGAENETILTEKPRAKD